MVALGALWAVAFGLGLGWAPAASAHANLLLTTPAVGSSVPTSPPELTLIFDDPVIRSGKTVQLTGPTGSAVDVGAISRNNGGRTLTAKLPHRLRPGVYTVTWQVVADDGDVINDSYRFAVGPVARGALSTGSAAPAATAGRWPTTVLRWVLFGTLALVLGEAAAIRMARRTRPKGAPLPGSWSLPTAGLGLVAALGLAALVIGNGSVLGGLSHPALGQAGSRPGVLALVEVGAFATAVGLALRRPRWAWAPLTATVVTEGLRAHPQTYAPGWGALVTVVHLTAVALWLGALVYVVRCAVAWRSTPEARRSVVSAYARRAAWLFAAMVASGAVSGLMVIPLTKVFSTGYGWLLMAKLAVVVVVAGVAMAARQRLRRGAAPTRPMRWEAGLLAGVLALTAALTAAAPPRSTNTALAIPPPPSGPVVPLGARAGLLGISVAASSGQAVVQLTAPGADAPGADPGYRLSLTLADPAGHERALTVRSCGVGCFVAPVSWQPGTSHLTLQAGSKEWRGGQAAVAVPWPAHNNPQALVRAVETLKHVGRFTLYERVTSDPGLGKGTARTFALTGQEFLERAEDPYRTGRAAVVDHVPGENGTSTLLLGYPGQKIQVEMTLDAEGRITRQTVTTPTTFVTRTFVYPEEPKEE
ncbi:hypothetical protein GCM10022206_93630 [Streptomyces chiangmaiensis]